MLGCATDGVKSRLCFRCERVYARYVDGKGEISTETNDPSEEIDVTGVENVMRFVIYIRWLKRQPNSFGEYLRIKKLRFDLWRDYVYKLWRL